MPLGYAEMEKTRLETEAAAAEAAPHRVVIYGSSDDLIEIEGSVPGCDEYNAEDAQFMVLGETAQVRVRVSFTPRGVWGIAVTQAAEGMEVLPVRIEGGEGTHTVRAVIDEVRLVTREQI